VQTGAEVRWLAGRERADGGPAPVDPEPPGPWPRAGSSRRGRGPSWRRLAPSRQVLNWSSEFLWSASSGNADLLPTGRQSREPRRQVPRPDCGALSTKIVRRENPSRRASLLPAAWRATGYGWPRPP